MSVKDAEDEVIIRPLRPAGKRDGADSRQDCPSAKVHSHHEILKSLGSYRTLPTDLSFCISFCVLTMHLAGAVCGV